MDLPPMVDRLRTSLAAGTELPEWQADVARCRRVLDEISALIDRRGASTESLYRHELLGAELTRLAVLLNLALDTGALPAREVGMEVVRALVTQHSIRAVGRAEAKRLALKITEYTGSTGEHYVVRSRKEWWANLRAGAYGGCVTAFTALAKFGISALSAGAGGAGPRARDQLHAELLDPAGLPLLALVEAAGDDRVGAGDVARRQGRHVAQRGADRRHLAIAGGGDALQRGSDGEPRAAARLPGAPRDRALVPAHAGGGNTRSGASTRSRR